MKKKVVIIVACLLVVVLIAACVMWKMGGVEAESALGDNQKYVYAYVSSIEGNEVTYMEVDESVAKAAEERSKEKAEAEDDAGSDSTGQSDNNDGGTDSAGQSDKSGGTDSDGDKSGMGTPPGMDGSSGGGQTPPDMSNSVSTDTDSTEQSGQNQTPPDMDSTEMPQGAPGGMSDMTGETVTTMIPVGVTVHTTSDTTTTFSRLATGDLLKILVETDTDGNEVIEEIWMLQ